MKRKLISALLATAMVASMVEMCIRDSLYSVQKPASSELFLGLCGAESGKRYLSSDGTDLL